MYFGKKKCTTDIGYLSFCKSQNDIKDTYARTHINHYVRG